MKTAYEWKEYIKSKYTVSNNSCYDQIVVDAFSQAALEAQLSIVKECIELLEEDGVKAAVEKKATRDAVVLKWSADKLRSVYSRLDRELNGPDEPDGDWSPGFKERSEA